MIFGVLKLYWTQEIKIRQEAGKRRVGDWEELETERACGLKWLKYIVYFFAIFKK